MECAARVAQETIGRGLPPRDRVRRSAPRDEFAWLRDELAGAIRPALWLFLLTTWFAARRRAVRRGRPPVAHPETLCPGRGRRNTGVGRGGQLGHHRRGPAGRGGPASGCRPASIPASWRRRRGPLWPGCCWPAATDRRWRCRVTSGHARPTPPRSRLRRQGAGRAMRAA